MSFANRRVAILRATGTRSIGRTAMLAGPARVARAEAIAVAGVQLHAMAGAAGLAGGTMETGARSAFQASVVLADRFRRAVFGGAAARPGALEALNLLWDADGTAVQLVFLAGALAVMADVVVRAALVAAG